MDPATAGTRILDRPGNAPAVALRDVQVRVGARSVQVGLSSVVVGGGEEADLRLDAEGVSGRHVSLRLVPEGCHVRDLGSRNGTFVDGHRVVELVLTKSARLTLGATDVEVVFGDGETEVALTRATNFGELLGHGAAMRAVFAVLEQVAKTDTTVLVTGESGTGKELAARALHDRSARAAGPFVVFDCAAASPTLVESQLFGHARGAFTGATEARAGVFEAASSGTLVLDELGELPLELQPKLLRALEGRAVTRLGETKPRPVDVRIVACTNRNLAEEVRAGRFREDLFFRLSVVAVRMPPLRERKEELPRLVAHFRRKLGGDDAPELPTELLALLAHHDFPGNVRELRNVVERALALRGIAPEALLPGVTRPPLADGGATATGHDAQSVSAGEPDPWTLPYHDAKARLTDRFERSYLERLLARHDGNVSEAARVAGLSRQSCYRLMHKYGLRTDEP